MQDIIRNVSLIPIAFLTLISVTSESAAQQLTIHRGAKSQSVRVENAELVHTTQLLPRHAGDGTRQQIEDVLNQLQIVLDEFDSARSDIVKVNFYGTSPPAISAAADRLYEWVDEKRPAVSYVETPLPDSAGAISLDAVFASRKAGETNAVTRLHIDKLGGPKNRVHACVLPRGDVVYVSGQAEPGDLAEATTATLNGLRRTLQHLKLDRRHIVQVKTFIEPMSDVKTANARIASFFGKSRIPSVSHVEWKSGSRPIEIELIAWAPHEDADDTVTFHTPPWMKSSPVFSRVARIHTNQRIYLSGFASTDGGNAGLQLTGVFQQLEDGLTETRSDLRHMAKATYYVSDAEVSKALNEIRPTKYDPKRPPAASKAIVRGVGKRERSIAIDMIAAPR